MEVAMSNLSVKQRDVSVDVLRGFAIVFMILGHSIFFRFGLTSWPLNMLLNFANNFCYVTFLFTFGYGSYYFMLKPKLDKERSQRIRTRIVSLVIMYYVAAGLSIMSSYDLSLWNISLIFQELRRVLLFEYFPGFTEYLPSFAIYTAVLYLAKLSKVKIEKYLQPKMAALTLVAATIISVATNIAIVLSKVNFPSYIRLFVGSSSTYDFPVMQYLPVFLLGIVVAKLISTRETQGRLSLVVFAYISLLISLILTYSFNITAAYGIKLEMINTGLRWPPSLLFLISGISKTMLFFVISIYMVELKVMNTVWKFLNYMGRRSMGFLLFHLIILFMMKIMRVPMFTIAELIGFLILIPVTYRLGETMLAKKIVAQSTI